MKPQLKIITNEFKEEKPKQVLNLNPPKFDVELIDFTRPGIKWINALIRCEGGRKL